MYLDNPICDAIDCIVCPIDKSQFVQSGNWLTCEHGHRFPIVEGVPILLVPGSDNTIGLMSASIELGNEAAAGNIRDRFFLETLGLSKEEISRAREAIEESNDSLDPVAPYLIAATNGILYRDLIGQIESVPIPNIRLPLGQGQKLLDIGCSWGRWSLSAAQKGYQPIGIDPSLGAVLAAKRQAKRFGVSFQGVVGDARNLPFKDNTFDVVFSYSVLQHFPKAAVLNALKQISRVTKPNGHIRIQMASAIGIRSFYHVLRRGFKEPASFDVRYWLPTQLKTAFKEHVGPSRLEVDCYFGLGLQQSDSHLYSPLGKILMRTSEVLRSWSNKFTPLIYVADSLYLLSKNSKK